MRAKLLQFWQQLNRRERALLLSGGVCLALYVAYVAYAMLAQAVEENTQRLAEKKETLVWMKQAERQLSSKQTGEGLDKAKALTVFSQQLKAAPFHQFSYQLQQLDEDELQVSFDKVPYNSFISWLAMMSKRYKMTVKTFHVEQTDTQGLVKLTVIFVLYQDHT